MYEAGSHICPTGPSAMTQAIDKKISAHNFQSLLYLNQSVEAFLLFYKLWLAPMVFQTVL